MIFIVIYIYLSFFSSKLLADFIHELFETTNLPNKILFIDTFDRCWQNQTFKIFLCNLESGSDKVYSNLMEYINKQNNKNIRVGLEDLEARYHNLNIFKKVYDQEIYSIKIYSPNLINLTDSTGFHVKVKSLILGNKIQRISKTFFSKFTILEKIDFSYNEIYSIDLEFYSGLKFIDLSTNLIENATFEFFTEVNNLDINFTNNSINRLPTFRGNYLISNLYLNLQYKMNKLDIIRFKVPDIIGQMITEYISNKIQYIYIGYIDSNKEELRNSFCFKESKSSEQIQKLITLYSVRPLIILKPLNQKIMDPCNPDKKHGSENDFSIRTIYLLKTFVWQIDYETENSTTCSVQFEICNKTELCDSFINNYLNIDKASINSNYKCFENNGRINILECNNCEIRNTTEIFKNRFDDDVQLIRFNYNKIDSIFSNDLLNFPKNVEEINLSSNQIASIANDAFNIFENLKTLILANNKIREITSFELLHVEHLDLSLNILTKFDQINFVNKSSLPMIQNFELNLENNKLSNIPRFSGRIYHVKVINFENQKIILSSNFGSNFFDLNSNEDNLTIDAIKINQWTNLLELKDSFCFRNFDSYQKLQILTVVTDKSFKTSSCSSSSNPELIISKIVLKGQQVAAENCGFLCDYNEKSDECSRNRYENDTKIEIKCKTTNPQSKSILSYFNLTDSNFNEIRAGISGYDGKTIETIIDQTKLSKPFLNKLKSLKITKGEFHFNNIDFAQFKNLTKLDLSSNEIQDLNGTTLPENLEELILDGNKIENILLISRKILELPKLKKFSLKSNLINNFTETFPKLYELILSDNQMNQIGENVFESCLKRYMFKSLLNDLFKSKVKDFNILDDSNDNKINWLTFISPKKNLTLHLNNFSDERIPTINVFIDNKSIQYFICLNSGDSSYRAFNLKIAKDLYIKREEIPSFKENYQCSMLSNSCKHWDNYRNKNCQLNKSGHFYANLSFSEQEECLNYIKYKIFTGTEISEYNFINFNRAFISNIYKIIELKTDSVRVLRIDGSNIKTINLELNKFENLTTLSLSDNSINTFNDQFLPVSLENINLRLNQISSLELSKLIRLQELDLSQNQIQDDLFKSMNVSNNLKILHMNNNEIKLHKGNHLNKFNFLLKLSLANNLIANLSSQQFPQNLTYLDLKENTITHLDKYAFYNLKQLEELNLDNNKLTHVNIVMNHKNKLLKIKLGRNNLKNFSIIKNVSRLDLDLSGNKRITQLTYSKDINEMMKQIENLDLSNCGLTKIDEKFFSVANKLNNLNLANNFLINLGKLIFPTISLLNLSSNKIVSLNGVKIESIPKNNNKKLNILLKNNSISSVPNIYFPNTLDTFKLDLDLSEMKQFSFSTFLDSLKKISSNSLEISKIDLSNNNITEMENAYVCSDYKLEFKLIDLIIHNNTNLSQEIYCFLYTKTQSVDNKGIKLHLKPKKDSCDLIRNDQGKANLSDFSNCTQNKNKQINCKSILINSCNAQNKWTEFEIVTIVFLSFQSTLISITITMAIYIWKKKPKL